MNYHKQPENKQEYKAWMAKAAEQQLQVKNHEPITCICDIQLEAAYMYHCYFCDLWLCNECAKIHFGERPEGSYNYKQYFKDKK